MQVEEGTILTGKVTGLTKFGAFVDLEGGSTGMVHISEVSNTYVEDIKDFLTMGQEVRVQVLSVVDNKISLSIKKLLPPEERKPRPAQARGVPPRGDQQRGGPPRRREAQNVWQGPKQTPQTGDMTFEDMMSKFKQTSDEKMGDMKRTTENRRSGGYSRRK